MKLMKIFKLRKPSYNKRIERNVGIFNKMVQRCLKLNEKIEKDIEEKNQEILEIQQDVQELNVAKQQNMKFKNKIEDLLS